MLHHYQKQFHSGRHTLVLFILISHLWISSGLFAFDIPGVYQCKAIRLTKVKNGKKYSKAKQTESLYIRVSHNEVRVFGTHSKLSACRQLRIRYRELDTLFLESPSEISFRHSQPKLYMVKDTVMGNVNLFDTDTSEISVKVIVKKLRTLPEHEIEKYCK